MWVGKSGVLEHKSGNISETRINIEEKLLWGAYRNSPTLSRTVPSPTPYAVRPPLPQDWEFANPTLNFNRYYSCISGTGKATEFNFGRYTHRVHPNESPLKFWRKGSVGVSRDCPIFGGIRYYLRNG